LRRAALVLSEMEGGAWWTQRLGDGLPGLSPSLQAMLRFPQTLGDDKRERARQTVQTVRERARRVFDEVDLLLLPTTPQPAFAHGAPVPPDQGDFTTLANAMGCAALCVPVPVPGTADDALPVGCQLLGPRHARAAGRPFP
jgi:aspartyl-tRNA(Asn)/glutamyl-tRNA(Gln) amidotransferase subunit A